MQKNEDCNKKAGHKVKNMTGELEKASERESEWKCFSTSHRIFSSSSRADPTEHPRPRLSEKQIWVILAFKNACVLVLFIFRLHANSKHRHEEEDLLVWMKSIVKPNQNHRLKIWYSTAVINQLEPLDKRDVEKNHRSVPFNIVFGSPRKQWDWEQWSKVSSLDPRGLFP